MLSDQKPDLPSPSSRLLDVVIWWFSSLLIFSFLAIVITLVSAQLLSGFGYSAQDFDADIGEGVETTLAQTDDREIMEPLVAQVKVYAISPRQLELDDRETLEPLNPEADGVDTSPHQHDSDVADFSEGMFGQGGASSDEKVAYLTFDDGPDSTFTPQMLDLLYEYDAFGTFFVTGRAVEANPEVLQRIIYDGHTVANHTWDHTSLSGRSFAELEWQLRETARAVGPAMAPCMRPPYGSMDSNTKVWSESLGYEVVLWDADPRDWERPGANVIADRILDLVFPGAVVLLHDGGGDRSQSVEALKIVLKELSEQGYRFEAMCR